MRCSTIKQGAKQGGVFSIDDRKQSMLIFAVVTEIDDLIGQVFGSVCG